MASFGESLRREREMRGITLEEISAHTKISIHFLKAIEADDLGKVPGGIYTRNFIRAFARYLGLDEERVMSEYHSFADPGGDFNLSRLNFARPTRESRASTWIGLLLAVAMLTGGYLLFRYSQRTAGVPQSAAQAATAGGGQKQPAAGQTAAPPSSQAVTGSEGVGPLNASPQNQANPSTPPTPAPNTSGSSAPPATGSPTHAASANQNPAGAATAPEAADFTGAPGGDLVLQVAATERAWVDLGADGKTVFQRVLKQDEIQTFKAKKYFDLTTGNAEGIVLTLNGETLEPLGRRGDVKKVHLTRDSLKHPPSN
ncbi:MAG: RodZ domain-containing protein [Terriglobia bacterium]